MTLGCAWSGPGWRGTWVGSTRWNPGWRSRRRACREGRCGRGLPRSRRPPACWGPATPRRAGALATLGANLCWQGRDHEAAAILEQVVEVGRPLANNLAAVWALGCLGALRARADDLEAAGRYARQATDLADRHGLPGYWIAATALVTLADVLDRRGRTAEAEAAAVRGLELARRVRARLETACALLYLARIGSRDGTIDDAAARVRGARQIN